MPFIQTQLKNLPSEIDKLKEQIQKAPNAAAKARLENNLQQAESYQKELQSLKPAVPTRTASQTMNLQEGGRDLRLMLMGRGHTDGDLPAVGGGARHGRRRRGPDAVHRRRLS